MEIYVRGVAEFSRKVRSFIGHVPSDIERDASKAIAEEVVETARPEVPVQSGRAARSLRVVQTMRGASAEGGDGVEYYAYLEFGGLSGRAHATSREVYGNGRYIFPAGEKVDIEAAMQEALEGALDRAGLEPH